MGEDQVSERFDEQESRENAAASLQLQLDDAKKQAAEYKDNWLRAAADLQNYRKRVERERGELADWANEQIIRQLLEVLDGFDAAFKAVPEKYQNESWVEGVKLVEQKLRKVLENWKVKPMEAMGKTFDPNFHEAMWQEVSPGDDEGKIIGEFQRGYVLGERVLRPARVKIAKGSTD